jgi:hypothetical protein
MGAPPVAIASSPELAGHMIPRYISRVPVNA